MNSHLPLADKWNGSSEKVFALVKVQQNNFKDI